MDVREAARNVGLFVTVIALLCFAYWNEYQSPWGREIQAAKNKAACKQVKP